MILRDIDIGDEFILLYQCRELVRSIPFRIWKVAHRGSRLCVITPAHANGPGGDCVVYEHKQIKLPDYGRDLP